MKPPFCLNYSALPRSIFRGKQYSAYALQQLSHRHISWPPHPRRGRGCDCPGCLDPGGSRSKAESIEKKVLWWLCGYWFQVSVVSVLFLEDKFSRGRFVKKTIPLQSFIFTNFTSNFGNKLSSQISVGPLEEASFDVNLISFLLVVKPN